MKINWNIFDEQPWLISLVLGLILVVIGVYMLINNIHTLGFRHVFAPLEAGGGACIWYNQIVDGIHPFFN